MANENLPPEKQQELMEGGLVGDLNKFVDWIASLIEERGGDPENPEDIASFMSNVNPHEAAGFGINQGGGVTTYPAPENPNPFTQAATNIGPPMYEATGNYTRGGEFRFSPSPNEAFGGGGVTSAQAAPEQRNISPGSGESKDEGKEKERVVAPSGTQPTPKKKEEKKETSSPKPSGGTSNSGGSGEQEVEALRGLANLVLGGEGPPQPGNPGPVGNAPTLGSAVGGVSTPQQSLNPFGNFRRF